MAFHAFLLRHAESADPSVFHGAESDVGLSPRGHQQAQALVDYLAPAHVDLVVTSAMQRAILTAEPLVRRAKVSHVIEPLLHERRVADLSGRPFSHANIWPETVERWAAGQTHYAHPGAESFDELQQRILPVWQRLTQEHDGRRVVVVAHGIVCKVILLSILPGYGVRDWQRLGPVPNVAVSELVHDARAGWRALRLNEQPPGT